MKKVTTKAYLNGEEKEIEVWIYDDSDYQLPKPMTNVFLMLLCLAITVLVGLYLYFQ